MLKMDSIPKYEIGLSEIYLDSKNDVMLLHNMKWYNEMSFTTNDWRLHVGLYPLPVEWYFGVYPILPLPAALQPVAGDAHQDMMAVRLLAHCQRTARVSLAGVPVLLSSGTDLAAVERAHAGTADCVSHDGNPNLLQDLRVVVILTKRCFAPTFTSDKHLAFIIPSYLCHVIMSLCQIYAKSYDVILSYMISFIKVKFTLVLVQPFEEEMFDKLP